MARPAGLEPATLGLAYHYRFRGPATQVCWSGLSLRHHRRHTYSLYGSLPALSRFSDKPTADDILSALRSAGAHRPRFPRDCHQPRLVRVPRYSAIHCSGSVFRYRLQLS